MNTSNYRLGNCQILLVTVRPTKVVTDTHEWVKLAEVAAKAAELTPLDWNMVHYPGGGITVVWTLSESHITVDTYPENNLVDITLCSCRTFDVNNVLSALRAFNVELLKHTTLIKKDDLGWAAFNG